MKVIKIDTPKGQYYLPLQKVAEHRANYYMQVDGFSKDSKEYQEEIDYIMEDDFEGIDWLGNNSDWEDWVNDVIKINDIVNITDKDFWCSSEIFEII